MRNPLWSCAALLLMLGLAIPVSADRFAEAPTTPSSTLDRLIEPVILTGDLLSGLRDAPISELHVYVYRSGAWAQIPFQVDEKTDGTYVTTGDGQFGSADELVFMSGDLGQRPVVVGDSVDGQPITTWHEVTVENPLNSAAKGWAYVVRSAGLPTSFTEDYVSFDLAEHRITGRTYKLAYDTPNPWIDELMLGTSNVDILDRTPKTRVCVFTATNCFFAPTAPANDDLIKDGPVRLIVRDARVLAYGSMASWSIPVPAVGGLRSFRYSTDFNENAIGAKFYNGTTPAEGVTVDGNPDAVPSTPFSSWWQVGAASGSVIQVSDVAPIGGTATNYYEDNATVDPAADPSGPFDQKRYGDTGLTVTDPVTPFTYRFNMYFPAETANVGAVYDSYYKSPLSSSVQTRTPGVAKRVYVPLVSR